MTHRADRFEGGGGRKLVSLQRKLPLRIVNKLDVNLQMKCAQKAKNME